MAKKNKKRLRFGGLFTLLQALASIVFIALVVYIDILPIQYVAVGIGMLFVFLVITMTTQFSRKISRVNQIIGKIFSIFVTLTLLLGSVYGLTAINTLFGISGVEVKTDAISIVVLKDSGYMNLKKLKDETFGVQEVLDLDNTNYAITNVNKKLKTNVLTVNYKDYTMQVEALYAGDVQAIVINEAFRKLIEEVVPMFSFETEIVYQVERKSEIFGESGIDTNVTEEAFNVFISGMDEYGDINITARSDVNMVATINPKTKEILLTSIPRDYYLQVPCIYNQYDKLTHAGIYGVDCSLGSVKQLLGIEIDYYVKLNFSSIIDIVDAFGGITVNSVYEFQPVDHWYPDGTKFPYTYYYEGDNFLNGQQTLSFVRERYNLPDGDFDRAMNQQAALRGIIDKAISPALIVNYQSLMKVVGNTVETNMGNRSISSLVKMQIKDMAGWKIQSYLLDGDGGLEYVASIPDIPLYVTYPNPYSLSQASIYINAIMNGEELITGEEEFE